jgi:sulfonate transport system ATP-binding protein
MASENIAALELRGISKVFPSESGGMVPALEGLNLAAREGEFLALIGPTGCGKTTALNIAAGLETPDAGEVRLAAGLIPGRNIPVVFQHYTLFPWRKLLANVAFGLQMQGVARSQRLAAARELLSRVGLAGFEAAYPHELSGGMRQRAAIAQALAVKPQLLLMDEPFGALDDATRRELQTVLLDICIASRKTVLFVTHNIDEAVTMADRVLVLRERPGRVVQEFAIDLPRPRNRLSREFTELHIAIRQTLAARPD